MENTSLYIKFVVFKNNEGKTRILSVLSGESGQEESDRNQAFFYLYLK